jgi:hypothetical protein
MRTASHGRARIALPEQPATVTVVPGRPKSPRHFRLASGRQLWRLNELGRLRVADDGPRISSADAKVLIAAEFERRRADDEQAALSASSTRTS